jgi:pimeloyl-ACP methyl ester carboxylesterase
MKTSNWILFLSFLIHIGVANAAPAPRELLLNDECRIFIENIKGEYKYDWLKTRIDPTTKASASNPDIYIFYYFRKSQAQELKNPVVFFNGGPGSSSHGQQQLLETASTQFELQESISFIYFDQRGTGCSSPYPLGIRVKTLEALRWFGSKGIVYDAEAIRLRLLGQRKWKVFGQSYGAQIVYRYITLFPQSISKAFAHGNSVGLDAENRAYLRNVSQYQVTQNYLKKYPDDKRRLFLLRLALSNKNRCFKAGDYEYCGYELISPLVTGFLGYQGSWPDLHSWLEFLVVDNMVSDYALQTYVDKLVRGRGQYFHNIGRIEEYPDAVNISLNFFGFFDWASSAPNGLSCKKIYDRMEKELGISTDQIQLDECMAPLQFEYEDRIGSFILGQATNISPELLLPEQVLDAVIKSRITLNTYSGEQDCYVPKTWFSLQNKVFGTHVNYVHFPKSGHEGYYTEKRVFLDLTQ